MSFCREVICLIDSLSLLLSVSVLLTFPIPSPFLHWSLSHNCFAVTSGLLRFPVPPFLFAVVEQIPKFCFLRTSKSFGFCEVSLLKCSCYFLLSSFFNRTWNVHAILKTKWRLIRNSRNQFYYKLLWLAYKEGKSSNIQPGFRFRLLPNAKWTCKFKKR